MVFSVIVDRFTEEAADMDFEESGNLTDSGTHILALSNTERNKVVKEKYGCIWENDTDPYISFKPVIPIINY